MKNPVMISCILHFAFFAHELSCILHRVKNLVMIIWEQISSCDRYLVKSTKCLSCMFSVNQVALFTSEFKVAHWNSKGWAQKLMYM